MSLCLKEEKTRGRLQDNVMLRYFSVFLGINWDLMWLTRSFPTSNVNIEEPIYSEILAPSVFQKLKAIEI